MSSSSNASPRSNKPAIIDPRQTQITRLKDEITELKHRLEQSTSKINQLTNFRTQALAQLAAQHDEIMRLRASATAASQVTRLHRPAALTEPRS